MKRVLVGAALGLALLSGAARANSLASVVVASNGDVYFSDYVRDKIWKVDAAHEISAVLSNVHTYHLVRDAAGAIYGEHRPLHGDASIWRLEPDGRRDEVFRSVRRGRAASYPGTLFTIDPQGNLLYLKDCQIVRLGEDGGLVPVTRHRCVGSTWSDDARVYGHLHGSMVWDAAGMLYFSDGRTIRRVSPEGAVTTLAGKPTTLFADPRPGEERFDKLMGLAIDAHGTLFAADQRRRVILRFGPDGKATRVAKLGMFWSPIGLAASGDDVYVLVNLRLPTPGFLAGALGNPTLQKISPDGRISTIATVKNRRR